MDDVRAGKSTSGELKSQTLMAPPLCPAALRLLKGSKSDSDTEDCKENSEDKEHCSDSKKEVSASVPKGKNQRWR